jgi:S-adenosylmethionine decarboxylase
MVGDNVGAVVGSLGVEWIVDAEQCAAQRLRDAGAIRRLVAVIVQGLDLHPVADALVHCFPGEGGIAALVLLSESHLTVHTFPESGVASLNLFCCRARPAVNWSRVLDEHLGARMVSVRALRRGTRA